MGEKELQLQWGAPSDLHVFAGLEDWALSNPEPPEFCAFGPLLGLLIKLAARSVCVRFGFVRRPVGRARARVLARCLMAPNLHRAHSPAVSR